MSRLAEKQNDLPKAEEWLNAALSTVENSNKKPSPLPALDLLDSFYERHAMYDKAQAALQRIIQIWSSTAGPDSLGAARYNYRLGEVLNRGHHAADAEQPLFSALAVFQSNGAIYTEAADRAKRQIAKSLSEQGKTAEAEALKASLANQPVILRPDVMPQLISKTEPNYSEHARNLKISGTIRLSVDIDESGHPQNIQVVEPLGEGLDENVIAAVQTWTFKPATKNGAAVPVHANIEVNFRPL